MPPVAELILPTTMVGSARMPEPPRADGSAFARAVEREARPPDEAPPRPAERDAPANRDDGGSNVQPSRDRATDASSNAGENSTEDGQEASAATVAAATAASPALLAALIEAAIAPTGEGNAAPSEPPSANPEPAAAPRLAARGMALALAATILPTAEPAAPPAPAPGEDEGKLMPSGMLAPSAPAPRDGASKPVVVGQTASAPTARVETAAANEAEGRAPDPAPAEPGVEAPAAPVPPRPTRAETPMPEAAPTRRAEPAPASAEARAAPAHLAHAPPPIETGVPPPIRPAMRIEQVAIEVTAAARIGARDLELRLDPPELGRIDVKLDIDAGGRLTTRLVVEKSETLDQLRRDAPTLERLLGEAGLKTDSGSLQFSLRDQGGNWGDQNEARGPVRRAAVVIDSASATPPAATGIGRIGIDLRI